MSSLFQLCDGLGPEKILHIANPALGLRTIVVVDNVASGPAIGGTRMAPDVSVEECARLARAMTLKNAAAGLPHGGAKSVIFADPAMEPGRKEQIIRAFASAIAPLLDYIPGPDMGTDESCMAWVRDEIGRSVGLPREVGGIPLDEIGATGLGVAIAAEVAQEFCDVRLKGARVAVQGFGAVGQHAARQLTQRGAILVAAADSQSCVHDKNGIDVDKLIADKKATGKLSAFGQAVVIDRDRIIDVDCDIWIPAARPDVLTQDNVSRLNARLVVQGANIPVTAEAEVYLHQNGILSIPDFIANAGGVICASVEYHGGTQSQALATIEEKIGNNCKEVLSKAQYGSFLPRDAAVSMAKKRVEKAMSLRRWK